MNKHSKHIPKKVGVHGYDPDPAFDNLWYAIFGHDFSEDAQQKPNSENTTKEAKNMANEQVKVKAPFSADVDGHRYSVKKCVKVVSKKDGKVFYRPIENEDIQLCFIDETGHVVGPVERDGGSWRKQLFLKLAEKVSSKKEN